MDGRGATGLLVNLTNCKAAAHDAAFNHWYDEVHVPEVLNTKAYYAAHRFKNAQPTPDLASYLALYETDWDDPLAASDELGRRVGTLTPSPHVEGRYRRTFRRISDFPAAGSPSPHRTTGLLFVLTRCLDDAREAEFNQWYDTVHMPERIETAYIYTASRYVNASLQPGDAKFLALYETDAADPVEAFSEMPKHIKQPTTRFDAFEASWVMTFLRI